MTRRERVWVVAQNRHGQKIKVAGIRAARPRAPARARPPRRQALHRLPRLDGRADAGRRAATRTTRRSARRRAPSRDRRRAGRRRGADRLPGQRRVRRAEPAARSRRTRRRARRRRHRAAAAGRSEASVLTPTPVAEAAAELGVDPILTPARLRAPDADRCRSSALDPDLLVLADYGQIVPPALLDLPHGALTCIRRCCRAIAARRRSRPRSSPATARPA